MPLTRCHKPSDAVGEPPSAENFAPHMPLLKVQEPGESNTAIAAVSRGNRFANSIPSFLAYLFAPYDLLLQRVRNLCHKPCHNQCASISSLGWIVAHENSTLWVTPGFCERSHCL